MAMARRLLIRLGMALLAAVVAVAVVPQWRAKALGHLRHETFYGGLPLSYWKSLAEHSRAGDVPTKALVAMLPEETSAAFAAADELMRRRPLASTVAAELVAQVHNAPDSNAQHRLVEVLSNLRDPDLRVIEALLDLGTTNLRNDWSGHCRERLKEMGPAAWPLLAEAAASGDPMRRDTALQCMAEGYKQRGEKVVNPTAVPALIRALKRTMPGGEEPNRSCVNTLVQLLGACGPAAGEAAPLIVAARPALVAAWPYGPDEKETEDALVAIGHDSIAAVTPKLSEKDPAVRAVAARIIARINQPSQAGLSGLTSGR